MTKYIVFGVAILSGVASAVAVLPYNWAHLAAAAIAAFNVAVTGGTGVAIVATQKAAKGSK